MHMGDGGEEADGDQMGDGVNVAARLEEFLCIRVAWISARGRQKKNNGSAQSRKPAYSCLLSLLEVVLVAAKWLSLERLSSIVPGRTVRASFGWGRRTGATPTRRPTRCAIVSSGA